MTHLTPTIAFVAAANAGLAQIAAMPDASTLEGWLTLLSRVGATAVLAFVCWCLWKQLRREQDDNVRIREKHVEQLAGVIDRNTKAIERVETVMRHCTSDRGQ